MKTITRL